MLFPLAFVVVASSLTHSALATDNPLPTEAKICAFADFNRDKYTDLLVRDDLNIFVRLQNEDGDFKHGPDSLFININTKLPKDFFTKTSIVSCAVGDFDGNSHADILVTSETDGKVATVVCYLQPSNGFNCSSMGNEFSDHPIVIDVNADGISDVLAFVKPTGENSSPLKCFRGQSGQQKFDDCSSVFKDFNVPLHSRFAHAFVDIDGDLSAELVFGTAPQNAPLGFEVWKRKDGDVMWAAVNLIESPDADVKTVKYGQPTFGDINADGQMDILLPRCADDGVECSSMKLLVWEKKFGWSTININDIDQYKVIGDDSDTVQLRMGDFDLDGFPDFVAVLHNIKESKRELFIIKNIPCDEEPDCKNITRTFQLERKARLIESSDISAGIKELAAFFDLREDGSLDVLVEYKNAKDETNFNFIPCEDKGDTTFLKVEVFTKICYRHCPDSGGSGQNSYGSSISWHGTTLSFIMSDTSGSKRHGVQTQLAQTSHRTLQLPFVTFGLGRSPNFVDTLTVGTPAYPNGAAQNNHWMQLVPNARLYIIPADHDNKNDEHPWISRLYMTPSRLIIQSLLVLVAACGVIVVIIAFLHWRERKQDLVERQAQAHRFHFDAM